MNKINVELCPLAKKHHKKSARQFAHVFHKANTICVTPEFNDLPVGYHLGILLHELGHIALMDRKHSECDADHQSFETFGVTIIRRTYKGMKNLEYVRCQNKKKAMEVIDSFID